jgi:hypothetical protein
MAAGNNPQGDYLGAGICQLFCYTLKINMHKGTQGTLFLMLVVAGLATAIRCDAYTRTPSGLGPFTTVDISIDASDYAACPALSGSLMQLSGKEIVNGDIMIEGWGDAQLWGTDRTLTLPWNSPNIYQPVSAFSQISLYTQGGMQLCTILEGNGTDEIFSLMENPPPPPGPPTSADNAQTVISSMWANSWDNFVVVVPAIFGILMLAGVVLWALRKLLLRLRN